MIRLKSILAVLVLLMLCAGLAVWFHWRQGGARRACLNTLHSLQVALASPASAPFAQLVLLSDPQRTRTLAEQDEFIRRALADELSFEGIATLARDGSFGPLTNLFPAEGPSWAAHAGVKPEECLAFRLDRTNGFRAEVILAPTAQTDGRPSGFPCYRIVRLNNVK